MVDSQEFEILNIIQKIDTNLAVYYEEQGRDDYYEEINDMKIGKFAKYCADRAYDSDAIETEFDCNPSNDEDIENCEIIGFDDNMPMPPDTPKTDIDKRKFKVLKLIYVSSINSNSTPYNIYSPSQPYNSCFMDNDSKREDNLLHQTCNAIGEWYKKMGRNNYDDINGNGLFSKWFYSEGMEINDMHDEFDEFENCGYLGFDTHKETQINYFPLPASDDNVDKYSEERMQFTIMSYCFKYAEAPNVNHIDIPPKPLETNIDPFDDNIDYIIDDNWIQKTEDIYSKLCPKLYAAIMNQEENLIRLFAIGYKYNISLVQLLTDTFMRDRLQGLIENDKKILNVSEWSLQNKYVRYLVKKYGVSIRNVVSAGIESYIKRIVPKFRMDSVYKIKDDLYEIVLHFKAATEFAQKVLVDGSIHHNNGGHRISNAPYQWDFCIAVRECMKTETVIKPTEYGDFKDEELNTDMEYYKHYDIIGDIKDKLQYNNCKFMETEFNPNKYNDTKSMPHYRVYLDSYNQFLLGYDIKKSKFPKGKRFCTLIDRRKSITKYIKNNTIEEYVQTFRNKSGNKMDDILFWIPPNTDCKNDSNMYKDGIKEVYFDTIAQCLIPGYDYNNTRQYEDDTKSKIKYKNLQHTITSSSKCNGALLIFHFQVDANDEIACYLCWEGQFIRFLPQDILQILPKIFVSSQRNNAFIQQSKKYKNKNIVNKIQFCDKQFDNWYNKISNK